MWVSNFLQMYRCLSSCVNVNVKFLGIDPILILIYDIMATYVHPDQGKPIKTGPTFIYEQILPTGDNWPDHKNSQCDNFILLAVFWLVIFFFLRDWLQKWVNLVWPCDRESGHWLQENLFFHPYSNTLLITVLSGWECTLSDFRFCTHQHSVFPHIPAFKQNQ